MTVKHSSVLLIQVVDGFALTMFRIDPARASGDLAITPALYQGDLVVEVLRSITVEDGHFIAAPLADFSSDGSFKDVIVDGPLWLLSGLDDAAPIETVALAVSLSGHDLFFDMPSDNYGVVLDAGSVINLHGGRIIISDGTLDLTAAQLFNVQDILLNSALAISVQQLEELSGTVSSGGSGILNITLADMVDAELLQRIIAVKTLPSGLTLALEAKTPEVMTYLDEVLLPEINETLSFKVAERVAGENDAPSDIEVSLNAVPENVRDLIVATFSVVDVDPGDTHMITLSDDRFVVAGNTIVLADGVSLDFEAESTIALTITATDLGGLFLSRAVNLQVIDVNEAPTALSLANTVTSAFENQVLSTRLLIADLIVVDDALGSNIFSLSGADANLFEVLSGRLYLKAGVLPEYDLNPNLDVTITVFDPTLPGSLGVSTQITVNLRETNAGLASASIDPVRFTDADGSNSYTAGDTVTLRFNSAINVSSFTPSDFAVSNGSLGNATLTAHNAVNGRASEFSLTLGSSSVLTSQSALSVKQYAITDIAGLPNANVISFALPPITTGFDIVLNYSGDSNYLSIFEAAVAVWERVIIGDLPDVGSIDDLWIDVTVEHIDGRGGVLGYASVTHLRSSSDGGLPYKGYMVFDEVDLASMPLSEAIDVAIHEIAHVLGFGLLWSSFGLTSGALYTGANAVREFIAAGGQTNYIPLETEGGAGTAYYHWDEDILGREIMTGYLNSGENYLSAITIGAMEDLGYVVDYTVAEPYVLAAAIMV
ncbi:leishmanolysin [Roseicyclus mahoneyensis]|uniref:Leishmanolysin n=1 Tax=Roseicyclus mahoneyensis TaxID=164332 RepID=A0A316G3J8_9RHOB|nr:leishmanolysin [Roseicyclus mahoneyensis]